MSQIPLRKGTWVVAIDRLENVSNLVDHRAAGELTAVFVAPHLYFRISMVGTTYGNV